MKIIKSNCSCRRFSSFSSFKLSRVAPQEPPFILLLLNLFSFLKSLYFDFLSISATYRTESASFYRTIMSIYEYGHGDSVEKKSFWKIYANSWFKIFNKNKPNSGFIGLWDYVPIVMTDTMLNDLLSVSLHGFSDLQ
jgi:hypothetical protein